MDAASELADGSWPMKIGDITYNVSMLTDRDYADLSNYIRAKFIALAYDAAELLKPEQRNGLIAVALRESINHSWSSDEGWEIIWREEGVYRIGHKCIRKRHPTITLEDFIRQCTKGKTEQEQAESRRQAVEEITKTYFLVNTPTKNEQNEGGLGGPSTGNEKS